MRSSLADTPSPVALPVAGDPELAPFWAGCRERRLLVQQCSACGRQRWPPRPACAACGSPSTGWVEVPQHGRLYSWTVVHRSPLPDFAAHVPYAVLVVELLDEPVVRMLGRLADGVSPDLLEIELPVTVRFERVSEQIVLPLWVPARATASAGP